MQIFVNERVVGSLAPAGATVGEILEAVRMHVDPEAIVTEVELDGSHYNAGEEERFARRAASSVQRLTVRTETAGEFVGRKRAELAGTLGAMAASVREVARRFRRREEEAANRLLASAMEELRLVLLLEERLTQLSGHGALPQDQGLEGVAKDLLDAEERRAWEQLAGLLEGALAPMLERWSAAVGRTGGD